MLSKKRLMHFIPIDCQYGSYSKAKQKRNMVTFKPPCKKFIQLKTSKVRNVFLHEFDEYYYIMYKTFNG